MHELENIQKNMKYLKIKRDEMPKTSPRAVNKRKRQSDSQPNRAKPDSFGIF